MSILKLIPKVLLTYIIFTSVLQADKCKCYKGKVAGTIAGGASGTYICAATIGLGVLLTPFTAGVSDYAAIAMCGGEIIGGANTGYEVGDKAEKTFRKCHCE